MRIHIEQTFGMLVACWRILKGGLDYSVQKSTNIVCLLMKLHNFCIKCDGPDSTKEDLTEQEKEELEKDIRAWYQQSDELARYFHPGVQSRATTVRGPRRSSSSRTKRDALVSIVKGKDRRMPSPVPLVVSAHP